MKLAKGLGKGINALFPDVDLKEETVKEVSIKECRPNPYQPRKTFDADAIEELKVSIQEYGIIQPLILRQSIKGYEIVAGERRYRAAKEAGLSTVPAIIKDLTDEKMMEIALLENLQREDLSIIEEAYAYKNLLEELKLTQEELSQKLGKSRSHIANTVRLLTLPEEVIQSINNKELSMGHGRALLGLKDKSLVKRILKKTMKEGLNVRQVEQLIQDLNNHIEATPKTNKKEKDIFLLEQEESLRNVLGTSVKIEKGKKKGKIEIEFYNDDELNRLIDVLKR